MRPSGKQHPAERPRCDAVHAPDDAAQVALVGEAQLGCESSQALLTLCQSLEGNRGPNPVAVLRYGHARHLAKDPADVEARIGHGSGEMAQLDPRRIRVDRLAKTRDQPTARRIGLATPRRGPLRLVLRDEAADEIGYPLLELQPSGPSLKRAISNRCSSWRAGLIVIGPKLMTPSPVNWTNASGDSWIHISNGNVSPLGRFTEVDGADHGPSGSRHATATTATPGRAAMRRASPRHDSMLLLRAPIAGCRRTVPRAEPEGSCHPRPTIPPLYRALCPVNRLPISRARMASPAGFEPAALRLEGACSVH
jgi:hypothetical protein